jgi:hypothetical protein
MALETSGTLSIGGTTTNRSINLELGRSATATSSLGETDLRDLAGVASGAIGIDDFYGASSVYNVENSLKLERSNSENLYRQIINGNRKTWTTSLWIKRTNTSASNYQMIINHGIYGYGTFLRVLTDDTLQSGIEYSGGVVYQTTTQVLRDTTAWMHIVWRVDTTQATAANRSRIYINGEQVTEFSLNQTIAQNTDTFCNYDHSGYDDEQFGYKEASLFTSMYYSEVYHVDGQSLAPTEFGEFDSSSGIWRPIEASISSFGNNGYYLKFNNSSNLGEDTAGNGSFTLSNVAAADQATDTPTNNFSTLNPLWNYYNEVSRFTLSEGGTKAVGNQTSTLWRGVPSTMVASSGKWYFEVENGQSNQYILVGVGAADGTEWRELTTISPSSTEAKMMYSYNGGIYGYNSSTDAWQYGGGFTVLGDIQSFAVDLDNGYMYSRKNGGSWIGSGNPSSGSSGTGGIAIPWYQTNQTVFILTVASSTLTTALLNFGGYTAATPASAASDANGYGTFEYAPPSGYYALCTKNLAEYG